MQAVVPYHVWVVLFSVKQQERANAMRWLGVVGVFAAAVSSAGFSTTVRAEETQVDEARPAPAAPAEQVAVTVLERGKKVKDLEGPAGAGFYFQFNVPEGSDKLVIQTEGDGNVDLFLSQGNMPSITQFDYAARGKDADEKITIRNPRPGTWNALVYGRGKFDDVEVKATWEKGRDVAVVTQAPPPVVVRESAPPVVIRESAPPVVVREPAPVYVYPEPVYVYPRTRIVIGGSFWWPHRWYGGHYGGWHGGWHGGHHGGHR